MSKSIATYWNPLGSEYHDKWNSISGFEGLIEELTLSTDKDSGEYTRLTRFYPGADTTAVGGKSHDYPEEIFIVSGRLFDRAFNMWLESGHYASRPPGEVHGPFTTDIGCVVLEISFPNRIQ
jgi:ChrR Cupin-like domain